MSYLKTSIIGGYKDGQYVNASRRGHWSVAAARALAARMGIDTGARLSRHTADLSGHGRGSRDAEYDLSTGEMIGGYQDVDDSADIHEICDEIEGDDQ